MTPLPVLLIGQSPRTALEAEIAAAAPGLRFTTRGALDGMTREEVAGVWPKDGPDTLFTILPSGETTKISKAAVTERMIRLLGELPGPALLACTGSFPGLPDHPGLIQPSAVLNALGEALLPRGRLALFVPLSEQIDTLKAKRRREWPGGRGRRPRPWSGARECPSIQQENGQTVRLALRSFTKAPK